MLGEELSLTQNVFESTPFIPDRLTGLMVTVWWIFIALISAAFFTHMYTGGSSNSTAPQLRMDSNAFTKEIT